MSVKKMPPRSRSPIFKYHPGKKVLGTGGYGKVELIEVPRYELSLYRPSWIAKRKACHRNAIWRTGGGDDDTVYVARKIYRRKHYFTLEMHNYRKLSSDFRKRYFVNVYRGYKRRVTHRVVDASDGSVFNTRATQHCLEMAYLDPSRWCLLDTIKRDDALVTKIFHQLLRCQLDLLKVGGVYYDTSPKNVFVCRLTGTIRLVDYGALFFPIDPQELYETMPRRYEHQRVPHPAYPNSFPRRKCRNLTVYDNYYFGGCSRLKIKPIPAFFGLVTVICTCLYSLPTPDKRGTERVLRHMLEVLYGEAAEDLHDIIKNPTGQKKFVVALQEASSLISRIELCHKSPPCHE